MMNDEKLKSSNMPKEASVEKDRREDMGSITRELESVIRWQQIVDKDDMERHVLTAKKGREEEKEEEEEEGDLFEGSDVVNEFSYDAHDILSEKDPDVNSDHFCTAELPSSSALAEDTSSSYSGDRTFSTTSFDEEQTSAFAANFGRQYFYEVLARSAVYGGGAFQGSWQAEAAPTLERGASHCSSSEEAASVASSSEQVMNGIVVLKKGWLLKQGELVKTWRRRWVVLSRSLAGIQLAYYSRDDEKHPKSVMSFVSTAAVVATPEGASTRPHEFKVFSSIDSSQKELILSATSNFEMLSWIKAIQKAITEVTDQIFRGDFFSLWEDAGLQPFLVRYGVRKRNARGVMQTRVMEINFADQSIQNTKRGETQTVLPFHCIKKAFVCAAESNGDGYGLQIEFHDLHRPWPLYHDTKQARDDMLSLLQHVVKKDTKEMNLRWRWSHLILKRGFLERRNISNEDTKVGLHATLKGRFVATLNEYQLQLYPEGCDLLSARPWFIFALPGLPLLQKSSKRVLYLGRHVIQCDSIKECEEWFLAIKAAASIPKAVIRQEAHIRLGIRTKYGLTRLRIKDMLMEEIKPQASLDEQPRVNTTLKALWDLSFPGELWEGNASSKWQSIGFQRGGPLSDLRASGILGLHCLTYFARFYSSIFKSMIQAQECLNKKGVVMSYPVAVACINLVAMLTQVLAIDTTGAHSEACSLEGARTFASFMSVDAKSFYPSLEATEATEAISEWEDTMLDEHGCVFEEMICALFPVLDKIFFEMDAGYMEFGQVLKALRIRIDDVFDKEPRDLLEFRQFCEASFGKLKLLSPASFVQQQIKLNR